MIQAGQEDHPKQNVFVYREEPVKKEIKFY